MTVFRDFVESTKDLVEKLVFDLRDGRDFTPTLHMQTPTGVHVLGVEPAHFDSIEARERLIHGFVVPYVRENNASVVAWTVMVWLTVRREGEPPRRTEAAMAVVLDRERHEAYVAPVVRHDAGAFLGPWDAWPPNESEGRLVTPIQEAMR